MSTWYNVVISGKRFEFVSDNVLEIRIERDPMENYLYKHIGLAGNLLDFLTKEYYWNKILVTNYANGIFLTIEQFNPEKQEPIEHKINKVELLNRYFIITPEKKKVYFTSKNITEMVLHRIDSGEIITKKLNLGTQLINYLNDEYNWTKIFVNESSKSLDICIEQPYRYPDSKPFRYEIHAVGEN